SDAALEDVMKPCMPLEHDLPLDEALQALDEAGLGWLPVVEDGRTAGRVGMRGIVRTYKETLSRGVRRVTQLPPETVLLEAAVSETSPLARTALAQARMPPATLVVSLVREGAVIYPRGDTTIAPGDRLTVLTAAG